MIKFTKVRLALVVAAYLLLPLAEADTFTLPANDIDLVGATTTVHSRYEDTLLGIARDHDLGYTDILLANPDVDP